MRPQIKRRPFSWFFVVGFLTTTLGFPFFGSGNFALAVGSGGGSSGGGGGSNATSGGSGGSNSLGGESRRIAEEDLEDGRKSPYAKDREKPKTCRQGQREAREACNDPNSMAGLGPTGQQAMMQAQQQQQMQQQQAQAAGGGQMGAAAACDMSGLMNGLQALMAGIKGVGCSAATKDCEEICKDSKDAYCGNGDSTGAAQAMGSVFGLLGAMMSAAQCKNMMAQMTPIPTPTPAMDCSDPTYAQTNINCICQLDPKNVMCVGVQQLPGGLTTTVGDMGPAGAAFTGDMDFSGDGSAALLADGKAAVSRGSQTADGGGGGGPQPGRGAFYNGANDGVGAERSTIDKNVISGLANGSQGGGGFPGGGGGSGGGSSGRGGGGEGGKFDLSKYLPKAKTRGLAGMSITSKDGITGPMGPSIWEKVSNQYQLQRQNLIQDK